MSFSLKSSRLISLAFPVLAMLILAAVPATAQFYDLEVKVGDTTGTPGETNSVISVFMKNPYDSVAGVEFFLTLEHPDLCEFQTNPVTLFDTAYWRCIEWIVDSCADSINITDSVLEDSQNVEPGYWRIITEYEALIGNHETDGTLMAGFEYVDSRSIGMGGNNLKVIGLANGDDQPPFVQAIGYQSGVIPLVKVLVDIFDVPDTLQDRDVTIFLQADNLDNFSFSDENGNAIGVKTDTVYDTNFFNCTTWNEDSTYCFFWAEVHSGPADSFWCCDTILHGELDTSLVKIRHGTLTVLTGLCGDANCSQSLNLLDITYLINYLYKGGPEPCNGLTIVDVNSSGGVNLLDITYLINYLYKGGPAPDCP